MQEDRSGIAESDGAAGKRALFQKIVG